jgi:hypothetical protein
MKTSIVVATKIIDAPAKDDKPAYTLIVVEMVNGVSISRTPNQFEADLRGSGFELADANNETRYRKGFKQTTYPEVAGLAVAGEWAAHKAKDKYVNKDGKSLAYKNDGYHLESGFLQFSKPTE